MLKLLFTALLSAIIAAENLMSSFVTQIIIKVMATIIPIS